MQALVCGLQECKCSPIALQPMAGQKAAILTVLIRLPTADEDYALPDQSGIAIGSTIVTIGTIEVDFIENNNNLNWSCP